MQGIGDLLCCWLMSKWWFCFIKSALIEMVIILFFQHRPLPVQLDGGHGDSEARPANACVWIECLLYDEVSYAGADHGGSGEDPGEDIVSIEPNGLQAAHREVQVGSVGERNL